MNKKSFIMYESWGAAINKMSNDLLALYSKSSKTSFVKMQQSGRRQSRDALNPVKKAWRSAGTKMKVL